MGIFDIVQMVCVSTWIFWEPKLWPSYVYMIVYSNSNEWYVLLCEWGKVGLIECVIRVETLQVSPKRVHLAQARVVESHFLFWYL